VTRECAWRTDREVSGYLDLCLLGRASTARTPALLLTAKGPKDLATRAERPPLPSPGRAEDRTTAGRRGAVVWLVRGRLRVRPLPVHRD
jgi:hypothetical protein